MRGFEARIVCVTAIVVVIGCASAEPDQSYVAGTQVSLGGASGSGGTSATSGGGTGGAVANGGGSIAGFPSGGAAGKPGGNGGSVAFGAGGSESFGAGGSAGASNGGAAPSGGSAGCASDEKYCFASCVKVGDPTFGCTASSCGACSLAHATAVCGASGCAVGSCDSGFSDCDGDPSNGCEAELATDAMHCGACATACTSAQVCNSGACTSSGCAPPTENCGGSCVDVTSSAANCGSCGNACSLANAQAGCATATCTIVACTGTFHDCDGAASNGCEADLASSATSCGACGHSCLGGACASGACQPIDVATMQGIPWGVAVDAPYVYWTNHDTPNAAIWRAPIAGGSPEKLVDLANEDAAGLALANGVLYFTDFHGGNVKSVPATGGTPTVLVTGAGFDVDQLFGVAVDPQASMLYLSDYNQGTILRVPTSGGAPTPFASSQMGPLGIAVRNGFVYWVNAVTATVARLSVNGGSPETLLTGLVKPAGLAVDDATIVWTDADDATGGVFAAPIAGGATITLAANRAHTTGVAIDATAAWFADYGSGIIGKVAR